jgi:acetylornithine deacetylase/succinyl-diaminopimelate desuccinylase-like protein
VNDLNKLEKALSMVDEGRIVELARELVRVPSVSGEEKGVAHKAKELLEGTGLPVEMRGAEDRPIVVSTINPQAGRFLAFNGHIDTVPIAVPEAWTRDPYDPIVEENRLYGRGSCDMKSSCGVIIHAMEILKELGVDLSVGAQLVPDEERGGRQGTRLLIDEMDRGLIRKPDFVVIGEKSNLKVRVAERGMFGYQIKFHGRATHTCNARVDGVNAIARAAKGVLALERHIDKYDPNVGHPVLSVNKIEGGGAVMNQVPAECTISIDHRMINGETPETIEAEVKEILDKAGEGDPDWSWEFIATRDEKGNYAHSPPSITGPETELGKAFFKAVPTALDKEPELFVEWAGGTDGRHYRYAGIQTIGFGPNGGGAHGPDEFVYVDTLVAQAKVYLALALELEKG